MKAIRFMTFLSSYLPLFDSLKPHLRGALKLNIPLAPFTWFRVGGPAEILFLPFNEDELAYFLSILPSEIPVTFLGLCSNIIIRDGGIKGVVIRLTENFFNTLSFEPHGLVRAGGGVPTIKLARRAADNSLDGFSFYRGIPGSVGGALRMNAGAHHQETSTLFVEARGITREGNRKIFSPKDINFTYRHISIPEDIIFTQVTYQGQEGKREEILEKMEEVVRVREETQPVRDKTGGSTFKNPPHKKAWELIDLAGCRGLIKGDAQVSTHHCNFLINRGQATAFDIESLGEEVRRRVYDTTGVSLEWEIKRIGVGNF